MPTVRPNEAEVAMGFPLAGIDLSRAVWDQRPRQVAQGVYARTTPVGVNVRGYEALADRKRGGTRPGLARYVPAAPVPGWIIQEMGVIATVDEMPIQLSQSGRVVTLVTVVQGDVYYLRAGETEWTMATNTTGAMPPLNFSGVMYSAPNVEKLWYADGINAVCFDPFAEEVQPWTASAGALPQDDQNRRPRLIETWRGRTVQSGIIGLPSVVFMSRVNDPTDHDYGSVTEGGAYDPAGAFQTAIGPQGSPTDIVTGLCAFSDDVLVVFCENAIYQFSGDPNAGGQLDLVTTGVGGVFGKCWCKDPAGNIVFVSNGMGIWVYRPGQLPERISQPVEQLLSGVNTGEHVIFCLYDDRYQGIHFFFTPIDNPGAPYPAEHLFYELRTQAWWREVFANAYHNPSCGVVFDGNRPEDRALLIGSWDGYVRAFSGDAADDDGTPIQSSVVMGPILNATLDDFTLHEIQADLAEASGAVDWEVLVGRTAEAALAADPAASGTWGPGRNRTDPVRRSGHAIYVRVSATEPFAFERVRAKVSMRGMTRRRQA